MVYARAARVAEGQRPHDPPDVEASGRLDVQRSLHPPARLTLCSAGCPIPGMETPRGADGVSVGRLGLLLAVLAAAGGAQTDLLH